MRVIPLEDFAEDILSKAQRGLGLPTEKLSELSNLSRNDIVLARKGQATQEIIQKIAKPLGLDPTKLQSSWEKNWFPKPQKIEGLFQINTPFYEDMSVNAYLYKIPDTNQAILIDTGVDPRPVLNCLKENNLQLKATFITHTHRDHIEALDAIQDAFKESSLYAPRKEPLESAKLLSEGDLIELSSTISIRPIGTDGHSAGGMSYWIRTINGPNLCFVGDSIFAGSMGGGMISYTDALKNNKEKILTLPITTVLCPGHGPMTTVQEELKQNPFF